MHSFRDVFQTVNVSWADFQGYILWRGLQYYRVFLGFSECSVIVQYMCQRLSSTVTLYTGDWSYSRVLLAFQINCRFGVGGTLDVPVRNIPT